MRDYPLQPTLDPRGLCAVGWERALKIFRGSILSLQHRSLHTYEKIVKAREKNHPKALEETVTGTHTELGTVTVSNWQIRKRNSQDIEQSTQADLASKVGNN